MKIKGLAFVLSCVCCLSMPMQVNAAEIENVEAATAVTEDVQPFAAGIENNSIIF